MFVREGMVSLVGLVRDLQKTRVRKIIDERLRYFHRKRTKQELFSELCFCILTANTSAELGIKCQNGVGEGFETLSQKELTDALKALGARFYNRRAEFIVSARKHIDKLSPSVSRDWLVKNVKGIGMKEASHFLRNVGRDDVAIIDFHILDILERYGYIKKPKTISRKEYLEIERVMQRLARELKMPLSELDLYLWYLETGKVLK